MKASDRVDSVTHGDNLKKKIADMEQKFFLSKRNTL